MDNNKKISREAILRSLSRVATIDDGLISLLALPERLFDVGSDGRFSFSSDPALPASTLNGFFFVSLPLPPKIPDYAIDLSMKGSVLFCTLVDRRRKIIVNSPIGGYGQEGDWEAVSLLIKDALQNAADLTSAGKHFQFVTASEDLVKVV